MNIEKKHIPKSVYKRPVAYGKKTHITIHSTGNSNSTIDGEVKYLSRKDNKVYASYHYIIDQDRIIEVIPPQEVAYHSGNRQGNWNSIGIEMVETGDRGKVIENTIRFTKYLMDRFNIPVENVVRHFDWEQKTAWRKICPRILNTDGNWSEWVQFKTLLTVKDKGGLNDMTEKDVIKIVEDIVRPSRNGGSPNSHWAYKHFVNLNARGYSISERRFDDVMTRGEVFAMLDRITAPEK